jgi:solute:Na+ symporter, SSS family
MKVQITILCLILSSMTIYAQTPDAPYTLSWSELPSLPPVGGQPGAYGVAGPYTGIHNNALIVAGGSNFPEPRWETSKMFHNNIWVLVKKNDNEYKWIEGGHLPFSAAYGACVSTPSGVLCMGGYDNSKVYDDVFLLSYDIASEKIRYTSLPSLPSPCCNMYAALTGNRVYIAGGQSGSGLSTAMSNFWSADISEIKDGHLNWEKLPSWPGPSRAFNLTAAQENGEGTCVYVMSGRRESNDSTVENLKDVYEFNPNNYKIAVNGKTNQPAWRRMTDVPQCVMAGTATAIGNRFIGVLGGADVAVNISDSLKRIQPLFSKVTFAFDTYENKWYPTGPSPMNHVTTTAVTWGNKIIIPCGEIKPRTRTPEILVATPLLKESKRSGIKTVSIIAAASLILIILAIILKKYGSSLLPHSPKKG